MTVIKTALTVEHQTHIGEHGDTQGWITYNPSIYRGADTVQVHSQTPCLFEGCHYTIGLRVSTTAKYD
jgi:hypothetical protein